MAKKLQILRGTTAQNDAYTGSIGELTMDTEKVEVRIHDGTTQGGKAIGSGGSASLPILIHVFSDHKLNDISWLNADTFSWQSDDMYVAAYEHLLNDYNSLPTGVLYAYYAEDAGETFYLYTDTPSIGDQLLDETGTPAYKAYGEHKVKEIYDDGSFARTAIFPGNRFYRDASKDIALSTPVSITETISGTTVTYFQADDDHKICLPDQEDALIELYNKTGVAWYYMLDTANKQFKLPRSKHNKYANTLGVVGNGKTLGLTDGVNTFGIAGSNNSLNAAGSYIARSGNDTLLNVGEQINGWTGATANGKTIGVTTNPEKSGLIAQQEQDTDQYKYLYFYVGNFERDAVEQTAGVTTETLNGKADSDLGNIPTNYDYVVESQMPTTENGYTWYRKYKSGWVEQGGRYANQSFTGGQATFTATLPIPVVGSNIIASPEYVSGDSVVVVTSWSTGTTANTTVERNTISSTLSTVASARWVVFGNAQ